MVIAILFNRVVRYETGLHENIWVKSINENDGVCYSAIFSILSKSVVN
jgi:hypothetical protein